MTTEEQVMDREFEKVESVRGFKNTKVQDKTNELTMANENIYDRMYEYEVVSDLNQRVSELEMKLFKIKNWADMMKRRMDFLESNAPKATNGGTTWSFEETDFLRNNYTEFGPTELAEVWEDHFPGKSRTEKSISSKASKIKVKYGLSMQDKKDISNILKGSGIIHKKKAIELADELGVNILKLAEYLQWTHKVGSGEDGSYDTDLKDQWNL